MEAKRETLKCDVLVIGSGGAGSFAAIAARQQGADVLIADRGVLGKSGATITAGHTCCAALTPDDSPQVHFEDTVQGGYFVNNQKLVDVYTREAPNRIRDVDSFGAEFLRKENGEYWLIAPPGGHNVTRSVHHGFQTGMSIMRAFRKELKKQKVRYRDNVLITGLLKDGDRVVGATGLDLLSGAFITFEAKATVLASGGFAHMWAPATSTPIEAGGDVLGAAFEAGAELVDMEFVQFLPIQINPNIKHINVTLANFPRWRGPIRRYAKMVNSEGEEILSQYDRRGLYATRDVMGFSVYTEVRAGRRVFFDFTQVPPEIIDQEFGTHFPGSYLPKLKQSGFSLQRDLMELSVAAHYCMGGARIDENASTNVPGLYAAGEVTGGVDGANRLGCNALTEIMVFGKIAGESAARYAASASAAQPDGGQIEQQARQVFRALEKCDCSEPISPYVARRELQRALWENVCARREEKGLKATLDVIEKLRAKALPRLGLTSNTPIYNLEWVQAIQLPRQLDIAEAMVRAALTRTESRGAHRRDDFSEQDDKNWIKNIILKREERGIHQEIVPAVITKLSPAEAISWKP